MSCDCGECKCEKPQETILEEAGRLVAGQRGQDYGHPLDDFTRVAYLWRAYFLANGQGVVSVKAEDVARMMILLKLSRDIHHSKRDNWVDAAGYARTLELIADARLASEQG